MNLPAERPAFHTLGVLGVGLLGGSLALAARQRGIVRRVIGVGRDQRRLDAARAAGVIDEGATSVAALRCAELVVVCTPVDRVAADVLAAAGETPASAIITDVGSTKAEIVRSVAAEPAAAAKFIPSHPLAGSEQRGFEFASATLFEGRTCVLTPTGSSDPPRLHAVEAFWQSLGMRTVQLAPDEHDAILAATSHLPHVIAAALVRLIQDRERPFTASGFRDTTRVASGDAALWTPILRENATHLLAALDRFGNELDRLRNALKQDDAQAIHDWLDEARQLRARCPEQGGADL